MLIVDVDQYYAASSRQVGIMASKPRQIIELPVGPTTELELKTRHRQELGIRSVSLSESQSDFSVTSPADGFSKPTTYRIRGKAKEWECRRPEGPRHEWLLVDDVAAARDQKPAHPVFASLGSLLGAAFNQAPIYSLICSRSRWLAVQWCPWHGAYSFSSTLLARSALATSATEYSFIASTPQSGQTIGKRIVGSFMTADPPQQ
jgi:hypothetical protein